MRIIRLFLSASCDWFFAYSETGAAPARPRTLAGPQHFARQLYTKAMELQPRNWALAEEVAELLLMASKDYADAKALAEFAGYKR